MAFIEPMHRNKPNITYLLTKSVTIQHIEAETTRLPLCWKSFSKSFHGIWLVLFDSNVTISSRAQLVDFVDIYLLNRTKKEFFWDVGNFNNIQIEYAYH